MSFDLDKLQAIAELGEVIRLHNDAMEKLAAFRKSQPHLIMPNLAKMVEENLKDNVQVLYKELNNLHRPAEQQTRYVCKECNMAFLVKLPGGICDECRARLSSKPRDYTVHATPVDVNPAPEGEIEELVDEIVPEVKPFSSEVADEVAEDLSVADEMPTENDTPEEMAEAADENEYTLSLDDDDVSLDDFAEDTGDDEALPGPDEKKAE